MCTHLCIAVAVPDSTRLTVAQRQGCAGSNTIFMLLCTAKRCQSGVLELIWHTKTSCTTQGPFKPSPHSAAILLLLLGPLQADNVEGSSIMFTSSQE
jgi:hypothetical protein